MRSRFLEMMKRSAVFVIQCVSVSVGKFYGRSVPSLFALLARLPVAIAMGWRLTLLGKRRMASQAGF